MLCFQMMFSVDVLHKLQCACAYFTSFYHQFDSLFLIHFNLNNWCKNFLIFLFVYFNIFQVIYLRVYQVLKTEVGKTKKKTATGNQNGPLQQLSQPLVKNYWNADVKSLTVSVTANVIGQAFLGRVFVLATVK